ncbi:MAG: M56 family metallopeptidase, partial [Pseudomonadota bacterium]
MTYSASLSAVIDTLATLLLHSLWQGALIGLLYALSLLYLRNAAPRARYGAALVALLALALAPALTGLAMALSASVPSVFSSPSPGELARSWAPVWGDAGQLGPLWVALWLAGVITLSIRVLWNWRRAQRLTHLGCHALSPAWETRLEVLARQLGVRRSVRLVESVLVSVPTVIGWLKPVILLPSSAMLGLNQRQLELIVAHELAHIARYDYVINYVLVTVETLWFHHPVVYLIGRGIRHERELCCDDLVISRCGSRFEYVSALTDIETLRSRHLLNEPLSNLAATGGDLLYRIRRIVKGDAPPSRSGGITAT